MPYRKEQFVNGGIYHITLRRIGDNLLFEDIDDYYRGIFSIYEFNNANFVEIRERRRERGRFKKTIRDNCGSRVAVNFTATRLPHPPSLIEEVDRRDKLVEILVFSLMPNHIHLLLRQLKDQGISKFMQKFGTGYSHYFRRKYDLKRKGHFFQDRFVAVPIKTNEQLKMVFVYIHINSLSLIEPNWKEKGIKDINKAIEFIENYKWSSYPDYIGEKNFPSVTEREFILNVMGEEQGCRGAIENWIRHKGEIKEFPDLSLE